MNQNDHVNVDDFNIELNEGKKQVVEEHIQDTIPFT